MATHAEVLDLIRRCGSEDEIRDAVECVMCEASLAEFVRLAWLVLHEEEPVIWNWHIDCLCDHLEAVLGGDIVWLLINVPPGFAKSLLVSVFFPAWVWLRKPGYKFLCSSTNDIVTLRDARRHKQLVQSHWYQRTFRPDWEISRTQAADGNFGTTRNGERISRTVRSSIIGMRPHIRIVDDPNDPTRSGSEDFENTNEWTETVLLKRRARVDSPLVGVQQRLKENDFTGYMLQREGNPDKTVHLFLPNRYEPSRVIDTPVIDKRTGQPWEDPRTEVDELLFPLILDQKTTDSERANDPAVDSAQNQQNPTPPSGVIFSGDSFRRWSYEPTIDDWEQVRLPDFEHGLFPTYPLPEMDYLIITADLNNLKEKEAKRQTDWAVFDLWGRHRNDYYLIKQVRDKIGVSASIQVLTGLIREQQDAGKLACVLVENKANGMSVIHGVRALLNLSHEERYPKSHQFIREWGVQGEDKVQRAKAIAYVPNDGRVYIPSEHEYAAMRHWLGEMVGFPNKTSDDRVDTCTMALTFFERGDAQFGKR